MKKIYLFSIALMGAFTMQAQDCSNLFISEYVEGWSNNKAIELYNPTNETIDLSNYALSRWSNGGTTPQRTVLEGTVAPGQTFVVAIDKRDPNGEGFEAPLWDGWFFYTDSVSGLPDSIYTADEDLLGKVDLYICPNYEDGTMYYNGNDAVTLEDPSGNVFYDMFGKIGEDPGDGWGDEMGYIWTQNKTLVRKSSVKSGFLYDSTQPYTFDPSVQWDSLSANTFAGLGEHTCDCESAVSINEIENSVSMYPNPNSSGQLTIDANINLTSIVIYNILGEKVLSKNYDNSSITETLTLDASLKGLFFVEVRLQNKKTILNKLLIN